MEWDIEELSIKIEFDFRLEEPKRKVSAVSSIIEATENDLSFCLCEGEKGISAVRAGVIICLSSLEGLVHPRTGRQELFAENPNTHLSNSCQVGIKRDL